MFKGRELNMVTPNEVLPPSLDEIKSRLAPFCRHHGIARLEVFGSLARGESHPGSDIDLLVTFQPQVHLGWDFFELHKEMEDILGCEVDLLTRRSVERDENAIRRRSILQSTCEIYPS
jgi:predicted nucleotidyltransferase